MKLSNDFYKFIDDCSFIIIQPEKVSDVKYDEFDEYRQKIENLEKDLTSNKEMLIEERKKQEKKYNKQLELLNEQIDLLKTQNKNLQKKQKKGNDKQQDKEQQDKEQQPVSSVKYVSDIIVVYQDNAGPATDCLPEDINKGFEGKYVYIKPIYTTTESQGVTSFSLIIDKNSKSGYDDLAKGTGGDYRYLIPERGSGRKIKNVFLSENVQGDGHTGDINKNRGGRYLYLCWYF